MNKSHLAVAVVAALALSSSSFASAEGGSHRRMGEYNHVSAISQIALSNHAGVLAVNTASGVPSFFFDTTNIAPHIDFESSTATMHFDTSTATANLDDEPVVSDEGDDDSFPAGISTPLTPVNPNAPSVPALPSWIKKPQAKSNEDNQSHDGQTSEDSQD